MKEVAEWVGITPAQVQSVASFYTMYKRERTGRYLISACTSISCMLLGGDDVLHAIEDESGVPHGETDDEGVISVEHAECIGACGGAPAVQVNYELIEGLTPDKARELVSGSARAGPTWSTPTRCRSCSAGQSFDWAVRRRRWGRWDRSPPSSRSAPPGGPHDERLPRWSSPNG
jgi:NADH-quinone oxidoreductase subunit E